MDSPLNIAKGLVGEVPSDPRIEEAVAKLEGKNIENLASQAMIGQNNPSMEKYGIKMRPQNLMQGVIISRVMALGEVDDMYQPWIWLWSLCAPISEIYRVIDTSKKEGIPFLMSKVHEWFNSTNLPQEITQDVMDAVAQTFALASQLSPKGGSEENGLKKNPIHGG